MRSGRTRQLLDRVLSIGADPADSTDERFRKRLLVGIALIILPAGLIWGYLYWVAGELGAALLPWAYVAGSIASLVVFARTRSFAFLRAAQLLLILVVPALLTIELGGLQESSNVILWSLLAPLGAVAFDRPARRKAGALGTDDLGEHDGREKRSDERPEPRPRARSGRRSWPDPPAGAARPRRGGC